jgi:SAM-dependent methyltransferase
MYEPDHQHLGSPTRWWNAYEGRARSRSVPLTLPHSIVQLLRKHRVSSPHRLPASARTKRKRLARWLQGAGIEIGAAQNPLSVASDAHVAYVDRWSTDQQRRRYPELGDGAFVAVTLITDAVRLGIRDNALDFVIASHVIEHLEDPIASLIEFQRVLRPGGILYLVVPDQRQTFDQNRAATSVEHLVRDHEVGTDATRWDHYVDWARNVMGADPADAQADALLQQDYSIHFHCWRPDTFLDFLVAARRRYDLEFEVLELAGPEVPDDPEFALTLTKGPSAAAHFAPHPTLARYQLRQWLARSFLGPVVRRVKLAHTHAVANLRPGHDI